MNTRKEVWNEAYEAGFEDGQEFELNGEIAEQTFNPFNEQKHDIGDVVELMDGREVRVEGKIIEYDIRDDKYLIRWDDGPIRWSRVK